MTAIAIDRMMGYRLVSNLAIVRWVFSAENIEQFHTSDRPWEVHNNGFMDRLFVTPSFYAISPQGLETICLLLSIVFDVISFLIYKFKCSKFTSFCFRFDCHRLWIVACIEFSVDHHDSYFVLSYSNFTLISVEQILRNAVSKTHNRISDLRKEILTIKKNISSAEEAAKEAKAELDAAESKLTLVDGEPVLGDNPVRLNRLKSHAEKTKEDVVTLKESLESKEALLARAIEENEVIDEKFVC